MLKTAALLWESVDVPMARSFAQTTPDSDVLEVFEALRNVGIIRAYDAPDDTPGTRQAFMEEAFAVADVWGRTPLGTTAETLDPKLGEEIFKARGKRVAETFAEVVTATLETAGESGLAPVDVGLFGFLAALLPPRSESVPRVEGALMQVVVQGVVVDADTPVDQVIQFREQHRPQAGRLRASLIDLAATIDAGQPPTAVASQAEAVIRNRVEPALADLESELKRSKLSFVWRGILGIGGVATGGAVPAAAGIGTAGRLFGRALHYAFDREALLREHPYGYLHRLRTTFGTDDEQASVMRRPITDPHAELVQMFESMFAAAYSADPRNAWSTSVVGPRSTDPAECFEALAAASLRAQTDKEPWWALSASRVDAARALEAPRAPETDGL
jgi:hypothetical protein